MYCFVTWKKRIAFLGTSHRHTRTAPICGLSSSWNSKRSRTWSRAAKTSPTTRSPIRRSWLVTIWLVCFYSTAFRGVHWLLLPIFLFHSTELWFSLKFFRTLFEFDWTSPDLIRFFNETAQPNCVMYRFVSIGSSWPILFDVHGHQGCK